MNPVDGASDLFAGRNFRWLLDHCLAEYPEREALVWRDLDGARLSWTYAELIGAARTFAAHLRARGVARGDRVTVHMANRPEFVIAWFALADMGAVTVSTNARLTAHELGSQLRRTSTRLVVTSRELLDVVLAASAELDDGDGDGAVAVALVLADVSEAVADVPDGVERFSALLTPSESTERTAASGSDDDAEPVSSSDLAEIQFTSGTTGLPKGVMWSQANLLWAAKVSAAHAGLVDGDRILVYLPLFHTNAQAYSALPALWVGGCIVLVPRFSARRFWPVSVEERATCCSMIPFAVRALLAQEVPADHSYRRWCSGIFVRQWDDYFTIPTLAWYGMTETVSQPVTSDPGWPGRHLAMGRPAAEYEVRVRGDDGTVVVGGGQGMLEVLGVPGVSLSMGYLDDPEATAASRTADGWFVTGDRVEMHADGWLTFVERDGDMLKVGGENVAALEIEQVIARVPGVAEVAVVALRDRMLDEVPVAFAVASTGDEALVELILEQCRARLADFKVPRHVWVVDDLPRATLEKISKATLRQRAAELVEQLESSGPT